VIGPGGGARLDFGQEGGVDLHGRFVAYGHSP
jgi:hypothetical protein